MKNGLYMALKMNILIIRSLVEILRSLGVSRAYGSVRSKNRKLKKDIDKIDFRKSAFSIGFEVLSLSEILP